MRIAQLNAEADENNKIIDLSIGTLDTATDLYIDNGVIEFIKNKPDIIHQFAPVKGFDFLLESISNELNDYIMLFMIQLKKSWLLQVGSKGLLL